MHKYTNDCKLNICVCLSCTVRDNHGNGNPIEIGIILQLENGKSGNKRTWD